MFAYESLEIWKLAIEYAKFMYKITSNFPKEEIYGLMSQLRRAAISISANIAEGSGASTIKDKLNYLDIAIKSTLETASEIHLAFELRFIDLETKQILYEQAEKIIRKIRAYKKYLSSDKQ